MRKHDQTCHCQYVYIIITSINVIIVFSSVTHLLCVCMCVCCVAMGLPWRSAERGAKQRRWPGELWQWTEELHSQLMLWVMNVKPISSVYCILYVRMEFSFNLIVAIELVSLITDLLHAFQKLIFLKRHMIRLKGWSFSRPPELIGRVHSRVT